MKRSKRNKDVDLMIRIRTGRRKQTDFFYQEIERIKFNFISTSGATIDVSGYLKIGVKIGKSWKLVENKKVKANIVKFRMSENVKGLLQKNKYSQLLEGSNYKIIADLGNCRFLGFRVKCKRPYYLTPKIDLLVTDKEVLILVSGEAPLQFADDFVKAVQNIFVPIVFKID